MGSKLALKCRQLVYQAAEYRMGGKKTSNTKEGSKAKVGNPGTNPMPKPAKVSMMGKGMFTRRATIASATTTVRSKMTISIGCMPFSAFLNGKNSVATALV
jgi:hypothetical protein